MTLQMELIFHYEPKSNNYAILKKIAGLFSSFFLFFKSFDKMGQEISCFYETVDRKIITLSDAAIRFSPVFFQCILHGSLLFCFVFLISTITVCRGFQPVMF